MWQIGLIIIKLTHQPSLKHLPSQLQYLADICIWKMQLPTGNLLSMCVSLYTLLSIKIEITFFPLRWKFPSSNPMKIKKNETKRGLRIVHDTDWMGHYHINEGNMWGDGWELRKAKLKLQWIIIVRISAFSQWYKTLWLFFTFMTAFLFFFFFFF